MFSQPGKLVQRGPFFATVVVESAYGKDNRLFAVSSSGVYYTDDRVSWKLAQNNPGSEASLTKDQINIVTPVDSKITLTDMYGAALDAASAAPAVQNHSTYNHSREDFTCSVST